MTVDEVLHEVAGMRETDWVKIQAGISELLASRLSEEESTEIREALAEAETELGRGEALSVEELRNHFGLS